MRKSVLIILLFLSFSNISFALTSKEVMDFQHIRGAKTSYYYETFLKKYPDSPFKKIIVNILSELYLKEGKVKKLLSLDSSLLDNYHLLNYAKGLKLTGKVGKANEIYLRLFRLNDYDERIVLDNLGDTDFLFSNEAVIRGKIWRATVRRNFKTASFYLKYLPENSEYFSYLKGVFEYKKRNYKKAKLFLKNSSLPESTFYLLLMEKNPFKKTEYLKILLNSTARNSYKTSAVRIVLNRFTVYNPTLCKEIFPIVENFNTDLYNEYKAKYYFNKREFKKVLFYLDRLNRPWANGLAATINKAVYGREDIDTKKLSDFYKFLLFGRLPKVSFKEPKLGDIGDDGLRYIVRNRLFDILEVVSPESFKSKDLAIAFYLTEKYRKAIKYAYLSKSSPVINRIKYPTPKVFNGDLVALSIARQESLFDSGAFSRSGAIGYMQIMPMTGKYLASRLKEKFILSNLYNEEVNVRYGTYYIKSLMKQFGNFPIAAGAYNGGPGRMKRLLKRFGGVKDDSDLIFFLDAFLYLDETRGYVKKVVRNCVYYGLLLNRDSAVCKLN